MPTVICLKCGARFDPAQATVDDLMTCPACGWATRPGKLPLSRSKNVITEGADEGLVAEEIHPSNSDDRELGFGEAWQRGLSLVLLWSGFSLWVCGRDRRPPQWTRRAVRHPEETRAGRIRLSRNR